jgi:hypothetical protein
MIQYDNYIHALNNKHVEYRKESTTSALIGELHFSCRIIDLSKINSKGLRVYFSPLKGPYMLFVAVLTALLLTMCIILYIIHIRGENMSTVEKIRKQFILDQDKIRRVKKIVNAKTDTEAITMALDIIIENTKIETMLGSIKGKGAIKDVYGRTSG